MISDPPEVEFTPAFFPMTDIELQARQILEENHNEEYLHDLSDRIRHAVATIDLYRQTGFTLSTPESVLLSLEDMIAMF